MSDFAEELDIQLMTRQPWCTCKDPYWCNGEELIKKDDESK